MPGLRGNPERTYPVSAVGLTFPGNFEHYVASIIAKWQEELHEDNDESVALCNNLESLGLTSRVNVKSINDTQVEIIVSRLQHYIPGRIEDDINDEDLVSIADVGLGVSQTLPVLVALLVAKPGQLVYLEQPEIHLHPSAQRALAEVIAAASLRGVKVVVETHSSLLLLGIQTLVAQKKLPPDLVSLHLFKRDADSGATTVTSANIDEDGTFGDWPVDFDDVTLQAQREYLDSF